MLQLEMNPVCQCLRSASSPDYIVPRTRSKFGDRAFSVAGPTVWNSCLSLSDQLRLLLVLSAAENLSVQHFILTGIYHLLTL